VPTLEAVGGRAVSVPRGIGPNAIDRARTSIAAIRTYDTALTKAGVERGD
jgi:hypothetical protein